MNARRTSCFLHSRCSRLFIRQNGGANFASGRVQESKQCALQSNSWRISALKQLVDMPGKHCCYGECKSDSRYPNRFPNVTFFPFPKPKTRPAECEERIKACGRPKDQLNFKIIGKHHYVCSEHFVDAKPTPEWPYPKPAIGGVTVRGRCKNVWQKRGCSDGDKCGESSGPKIKKAREENRDTVLLANSTQPCDTSGLLLLASTATERRINELERENKELKDENTTLKEQLKHFQHAHNKKKFSVGTQTQNISDYTRTISQSKIKNLFKHYTGLKYVMFLSLFSFLVPNKDINPVTYRKKRRALKQLSSKDQLFLVLCRLRRAFSNKDLAFRFSVSEEAVSDIFLGWITHMKCQFGFLSWWPHRDRIISNMHAEYKKKFPTTIAIIDCTELKTQRPSSLKLQSQCYSDYISTTTLKSLVATDPMGNLMYVSKLFTGSISDNEICEQSLFYKYLQKLRQRGIIQENDAIMADKGFRIEDELKKIGINLNIPPFASSERQMDAHDVARTNSIAAHRIHVERRIGKIKTFKLVGETVQTNMFPIINDVWYVCCHLSNFEDVIITK